MASIFVLLVVCALSALLPLPPLCVNAQAPGLDARWKGKYEVVDEHGRCGSPSGTEAEFTGRGFAINTCLSACEANPDCGGIYFPDVEADGGPLIQSECGLYMDEQPVVIGDVICKSYDKKTGHFTWVSFGDCRKDKGVPPLSSVELDLASLKINTEPTCQHTCRGNPECVGIEYDPHNPVSQCEVITDGPITRAFLARCYKKVDFPPS
ncbi:unnamed protein product [Vitrella brassicaformis CCMP3155]|uniref:Apple domain-containing protein n=2 Tax=Vitrella brassicaformis TaxID=1169539 RepID=A0A0G4GNR8_VITBC|nr:unnamed protein product [Vitrella brassicaformis CCMP3155]|mmetsp:Transcript_38634/g.110501  ORF Transcript_38634/g.110501 Transcript_38634/m.110501 type:complete len:209 (-) Transcript_38634:525-1151(-)|eukprot:CEM31948.1 unnamed protein product [Vitrella brassicaformis CCMP3155]